MEALHGSAPEVPVLRPRLPRAEQLLPYLRRIDDARVYTNWGPLNDELEERLSSRFGLLRGSVTTASSGTAALVAAILATAGRASDRPLAIVPAFTFVATVVAVELAGHEPVLADVDEATWALEPERLGDEFDLDRVGVVVPVAPFGRPVALEAWQQFRRRTGCAVVVDAAGSFEFVALEPAPYLGSIPIAMSFHATKAFSTGEGGCVATTDPELADDVMGKLNFGFHGTREATSESINGKLSEYHAAIGLASLDAWEHTSAVVERLAGAYRAAFEARGIGPLLHVWPEVSSAYAILAAPTRAQAAAVGGSLRRDGIDYRFWYGDGVHRHRQYSGVRRGATAITDDLAPRLIGLPAGVGLDDGAIERIAAAVAGALER